MHSRNDKLPGRRRLKYDLGSRRITNLADQHHFWILPQNGFKTGRPVEADTGLDLRLRHTVDDLLNWVFQRNEAAAVRCGSLG